MYVFFNIMSINIVFSFLFYFFILFYFFYAGLLKAYIWFAMNIHKDLLCVKNYKVNTWNTYIHFVFNFSFLFTILLICLKGFFFFFLQASLHSFPPHRRLGHSSLPKRGQVRDLKVGWNFYRQVCLYGYKFHVENKLKKKQHKYVVVKGVDN